MEYDSLRQRPTGRVPHILIAVAALLSSFVSTIVNGYSFAPLSEMKDLGFYGSSTMWKTSNGSQVPVAEWIRYAALGLVYPWQLVWIAYCILQLSFKVVNVSVPWKVLAVHVLASVLDVVVVYTTSWTRASSRETHALPLGFSILLLLALYSIVAMAAFHLYTIAPDINRGSRWMGWILVLNGVVAYATWITIDTMLDMDDVMRLDENSARSAGMIVLIVVGFFTVTYFLLEATLLDRFLRGVFIVYPIVIWAIGGIYAEQVQWHVKGLNVNLSLALLAVACVLFLFRIMLQVLYSQCRTLPRYKPNYVLR